MTVRVVLAVLIALGTGSALPAGQNPALDEPFVYSNSRIDVPNERIIGGDEAQPHAYPYQVGLYCKHIGQTKFCGGSLVSPNYVLTAAHCVDGIISMDLVFGAHSIEGNEDPQIKVTSDEFIIHPGYDKEQLINDIALVKLRASVSETEYIKVVTVARGAETYAGREGVAIGWGRTSNGQDGLTSSLRYVVSDILTNQDCKDIDPYSSVIQPTHLCFSGLWKNVKVGTCNGDFGGPLVVDGVQVGVGSFGYKDCGAGKPGVFTRLSEFTDWIQQNSDVDV